MTSEEVREAMVEHIKNKGISIKNKVVTVQVKSGRKGNGPVASIQIEDESKAVSHIDNVLAKDKDTTDLWAFSSDDDNL